MLTLFGEALCRHRGRRLTAGSP